MAPIPAVCESCGELFVSHNAIAGKGSTTGEADRVGPCPTCGARWGRVIDGNHELAEDLTHYLSGADIGPHALRELQGLIARVRDGTMEPAAAASEIRSKVPAAAGTAWLLSARGVTQSRWLALLAAIIAVLLEQGEDGGGAPVSPVSPEQIEQIVHDVEGREPEDDVSQLGPAVSTKVARNAPCPCGSGDKYKHCHGRMQTSVAQG